MAQRNELGLQHGHFVDQPENVFHRASGRLVMELQNDAGEFSGTKRNQDAAPGSHTMPQSFRQLVSETLIERNRQADIAKDHGAVR